MHPSTLQTTDLALAPGSIFEGGYEVLAELGVGSFGRVFRARQISTGQEVPLEYLAWDGLYCLLYSSVAMLVALLLFEDRDLA